MVEGSTLTKELTKAQAKILGFIRQHLETHGVPPSFREIQAHFDFSAVGTVQDHVRALRRKGALEAPKGRQARALMPAGFQAEGVKKIPIYGEIAAGSTRDAPQVELGALVIADRAAKDPCFALRVVGDSMIDAGILEGDFVIVERKARVKNGDIVVALVNGETTVKRYFAKPDGIYLVPENTRLKPMRLGSTRFEIQGKVVGLQRKL